mgnify:CR=1 FL=1
MKLKSISTAIVIAAAAAAGLATSTAFAQAKEQFFPVLVYRTGAYAPNGVPWANGYVDYLKYTNAKGGMNGVKITYEECETGYATDKGVECYERLKGKGATVFQPLSTGITFALTEKAPGDKIPLITAGYGRSESQDGNVFKWNFPIAGTYWVAADALVQHVAKKEGGLDKLKGKKIALVYHDSPYGKEPIPLLQQRAALNGFELQLLPVTAPGVEQYREYNLAVADFAIVYNKELNPVNPPNKDESAIFRGEDTSEYRPRRPEAILEPRRAERRRDQQSGSMIQRQPSSTALPAFVVSPHSVQ